MVDPALMYKLGLVVINACEGGFSAGEKATFSYWERRGLTYVRMTVAYTVQAGGRDLATSDALKQAGDNVKFFGLKRTLFPIGFPNPFGLQELILTDFQHMFDEKFFPPGLQGTKKKW